ncbi:conserved protein, unknown function [Hepatocystis sp. ex Piliocolobus tephrosceles]|nr:conserved protein, unknown function [Hepatocystis sp. ex Piliocolobus tephrosceles]
MKNKLIQYNYQTNNFCYLKKINIKGTMKIYFFAILIFILQSCLFYGKSSLKKKGKKGKMNTTLGGDFLGDITPFPNSVYNVHIDLNKNYELNDFVLKRNEKINKTLFLMYKEHDNTMKELQSILHVREKLIYYLIDEITKLKI